MVINGVCGTGACRDWLVDFSDDIEGSGTRWLQLQMSYVFHAKL